MEPSGYVERPDYRVDILARRNEVSAWLGDTLLARTTASLLVDEQDHGLVFYFPRADVLVELTPDPQTSRCPYKGDASYWRFDGDGDSAICWSYDDPYPPVLRIVDHVAFYQDRVRVQLGVATPAVVGYPSR